MTDIVFRFGADKRVVECMNAVRHERIVDERRRRRIVRWYYATHLIAFIGVIFGFLIRFGPPADLAYAAGMTLWLGGFGASSVLLLTGGLLGIYETSTSVTTIKVTAALVSLLSGFLIYGLGIITTPVLLLAGILLRALVMWVQRRLGLQRAPATVPA